MTHWTEEQNWETRNKYEHIWSKNIWQGSQEYSMEKTVFSIKGAGKIGYSQVKRITLDPSLTAHKNYLKMDQRLQYKTRIHTIYRKKNIKKFWHRSLAIIFWTWHVKPVHVCCHVRPLAIPWIVAHEAPLSKEFSRR